MKRSTIQFKVVIISSLLLIALVLSSCSILGGGGEEAAAPPLVLGHQATLAVGVNGTLVCSQECSERGFCGTDPNGTTVVILNTSGPATRDQNLIIPANTQVNIQGVENREVMVNSTLERFMLDFYLVNSAQNGQGWVAGYCIGQ